MKKSNKSIAGYHLLMILSSIDGKFRAPEGLMIRDFLEQEFPFRVDLDDELDIIANLKPEEWEKHFEFHAQCFYDDTVEQERKDFLTFVKKLIKIDHIVTAEEHQYYSKLKKLWNLTS